MEWIALSQAEGSPELWRRMLRGSSERPGCCDLMGSWVSCQMCTRVSKAACLSSAPRTPVHTLGALGPTVTVTWGALGPGTLYSQCTAHAWTPKELGSPMTSLERLCHACHLGADRSLCVEQQDGAGVVELLCGQSSWQVLLGSLPARPCSRCLELTGRPATKLQPPASETPFSPVKCILGSLVQMILTILEIFI